MSAFYGENLSGKYYILFTKPSLSLDFKTLVFLTHRNLSYKKNLLFFLQKYAFINKKKVYNKHQEKSKQMNDY